MRKKLRKKSLLTFRMSLFPRRKLQRGSQLTKSLLQRRKLLKKSQLRKILLPRRKGLLTKILLPRRKLQKRSQLRMSLFPRRKFRRKSLQLQILNNWLISKYKVIYMD